MRIELNCAVCGENRFNLADGIKGDELVRCDVCGHEIGTLAQLKEQVAEEVLKHTTPPA